MMKSKHRAIKSIAVSSVSVIAIAFIIMLLVATLNTAFPVGTPIHAEIAVLMLMIAWIYASMILARIVYEAGRVIAGNTCKYDFVATGICGIWLVRKDKKYKLVRASRYGIYNGTIMAPPACEYGYFPVIGYNNSGIIYCSAVAIICLAVCVIPVLNVFVKLSLFILAVQNLLLAFSSAFASAQNGGICATSKVLRKSYDSIERMWQLLKIQELLTKGESISTMDEDLFGSDGNDVIDVKIKRHFCQRMLYNGEFESAKAGFDKLLQDCEKNSRFNYALTADYCVSKLILGEEFIPTKQFLKYVNEGRYDIPLLRTRYAIELLINKNTKKAQKLKKRFERVTKDSPFTGTVNDENMLIEAINKAFVEKN